MFRNLHPQKPTYPQNKTKCPGQVVPQPAPSKPYITPKAMNKKTFLASLAMLLACTTISAQVPSIPSRAGSRPRPPKAQKVRQADDYRAWGTKYDWLSTRYATYDDIRNLDGGQIRVLKNSIYARHGYIFKDSKLARYFGSFAWYNPRYNNVPTSHFNKIENANIAFLNKYQR